jgi:WD40 repeat protein
MFSAQNGISSASGKGEARIVVVPDGHELARFAHYDDVNAVAFSPDGKFLATASGDALGRGAKGEARIVAVADGRELARVDHAGPVRAVAFSPDGKFLATASGATTARIVVVPDGRELARVDHAGPVRAVAFSPDGKFLATASWDNTARFWSTTLDDMLDQLCTGQGRNLSLGEWHRYLGDLPWRPTCGNWPMPKD